MSEEAPGSPAASEQLKCRKQHRENTNPHITAGVRTGLSKKGQPDQGETAKQRKKDQSCC
ncbi:hypothetical protein SIN01_11630 [Sporolactobacillus inulinus]|nr:hypothetical protein SIN01_11630 [Sporolactobacillus inulinus]